MNIPPVFAAWLLSLGGTAAAASSATPPSWHRFGANVNYRLTAVVDVNGGARGPPEFDAAVGADGELLGGAAAGGGAGGRTPGYSIPIEVLTLRDDEGRYRQRVGYYGGTQVEYNDDGAGYRVVATPYQSGYGDAGAKVCFETEGHSSDVGGEQAGYLNFFPTVEQMEQYTLGGLVTNEPGIPYHVATLQAPHGSHNATAAAHISTPSASYTDHPGMPSHDWFQFHYREGVAGEAAVPLKWTMLARNQIINAHTENWVVRYLTYEALAAGDRTTSLEAGFDAGLAGDCGASGAAARPAGARRAARHNRLGLLFSATARPPRGVRVAAAAAPAADPADGFARFVARHNKHYPPHEYARRRAVHARTARNIARWNREHAGRTAFAANEFLDLEAREVLQLRGGHVPRREEDGPRNVRAAVGARRAHARTTHELPGDFDPAALPAAFDWRDRPGAVGPIKDQGFCGSCWAFSFLSALESHWFLATNSSVDLPEQFVNDCAWSRHSSGCDGGSSGGAAETVLHRFQGRVPVRGAYGGYLSVNGECYVDVLRDAGLLDEGELTSAPPSAPPSSVQLTDWVDLPPRHDTVTKHALYTKGPLSVSFNVVDEALYYANGVLDVASCTKNRANDLDHAINLVGWGVDELSDGSTAEHWILRNSWSTLWGDAGYLKVRMGERDCGVTTNAGYPVVAQPSMPGGTPQHAPADLSDNFATG